MKKIKCVAFEINAKEYCDNIANTSVKYDSDLSWIEIYEQIENKFYLIRSENCIINTQRYYYLYVILMLIKHGQRITLNGNIHIDIELIKVMKGDE